MLRILNQLLNKAIRRSVESRVEISISVQCLDVSLHIMLIDVLSSFARDMFSTLVSYDQKLQPIVKIEAVDFI